MNTMDRYIALTFIGSYVLLLVVGMGLYIFGDVLFNLDEFTEDPELSSLQVFTNMVDFYTHNIPRYYHQLGGVMLAVAGSFTFAMMLRNNELTALVAAGVPLQRLAVPVLLTSVVLMTAWVANSEVLVPNLASKIARTHDDVADTRTVEVHCVRDHNNAILSATELRAGRGLLRGVYVIEPDDQGNPTNLIRADAAVYDPQHKTWKLDVGRRLTMGHAFTGHGLGQTIQWEPLDEYPFTLAPDQILLRQSAQWAELMSIRQMTRLLRGGNLPNKPAVAKAQHIRFTQPLLAFILVLLAVPFFLTAAPANVLVAGGKALVLSGACFAFAFVAHSIPTDVGTALLVTALPVLVFAPVAVLHFMNVRT